VIGWQHEPIGKVVKRIATGSTPSTSHPEFFGGQIPWFTPGDIGSTRNLVESSRYITEKALSDGKARLFEEQTLLVTCIGDIGRAGILQVPASSNQQITALKFNDEVDVYYAYYWFIAHQHKLESQATQAVVPILNNARLKEIDFFYPPLPEQKRVAAILAKADRLRRLRRTARDLSDSYLQSVFLERFYTNASSDWPRVTIASLAKEGKNTIRTGPFGSQLLHSEFVDEGIAVLGIDNAVQNRFVWGKPRFITEEKYQQIKRYKVFPGDVIITIMGTTGRCAIIPDDIPLAINTKHLCCITLDQSRCLPAYLQSCFLNHPSVLQQLGVSERGAVMPGLNMGIIKDLIVPLPPLPLQQKFARVIHKFEWLRAQQREAERQTLLHRAFRGELEDPKGLGDP
jgi:type I restriction enzyme S subunit